MLRCPNEWQSRKREIINGEEFWQMPAAPQHNLTAMILAHLIYMYIKQNKLQYKLFLDSLRMHYNNNENYYEPDIAVVKDPTKIDKVKNIYTAPDLVIEILSPRTQKRDLTEKLVNYGKMGVPEYWIVDVDKEEIMQYLNTSDVLVINEIYQLPPEDYDPEWDVEEYITQFHSPLFGDGLTVDLEEIFKE
jgi:Uma2 family endonuclease